MTRLRHGVAATTLIMTACSAGGPTPSAARSALAAEGTTDAGTPDPIDAGVDAPPCEGLCLSGDRADLVLVPTTDPWMTYSERDVFQSLGIDSAGGTLDVVVTVTGNFGKDGEEDGVVVTVGTRDTPEATRCPSPRREAQVPAVNECHAVVEVPPGHAEVPVWLWQWNGSAEAWSIALETATATLR